MVVRCRRLLLLPAVVLAAGCGGGGGGTASPVTAPALRGLVPQPLPRKPRLSLTDAAGRAFSLAAATAGKLTYVYFGYTHCPDACPLTMSDIATALHEQPPAIRKRIAVVFVTVDPARDTPSVLRDWLAHFDRGFIGLTGSPRQIVAAEEATGVPVAPGRHLQHSTLVFAYGADNLAHVVYSEGFRAADYAHDMPLLLAARSGG